MYGFESWTIKKGEHRRIDAFELWCWRRFLRVLWTARRSNQSILKEINPGCSLEGLMLKLKLQYFGHLMQRADSFEDPDAGKDWGQEEKGTTEDEMVDGITDSMDMSKVADGQGGLACCSSCGYRVGHDWATELNYPLEACFLAWKIRKPKNLSHRPQRKLNELTCKWWSQKSLE